MLQSTTNVILKMWPDASKLDLLRIIGTFVCEFVLGSYDPFAHRIDMENELGFPLWLRLSHYINFLFLTLIIRSGIQILADHPKLYWNDHCHPGSEWLRFGRRQPPEKALWTSMDEAIDVSPLIALPGKRHALGNGRHWHFMTVFFWTLNGAIYLALLISTGNWRRLIPTSWDIIPAAVHTFLQYITFHIPDLSEFHPYDPLQQIAYASIVFLVTPLTILSGIAMSPAIGSRFAWYQGVFNGQQKARSIHFLCMIAYVMFAVVHVSMVFLVYFKRNVLDITLGDQNGDFHLALLLFLGGIASVLVVNLVASLVSFKNAMLVQNTSLALLNPFRRLLLRGIKPNKEYADSEISPYFRVNGRPPETEEFLHLQQGQFDHYRLIVDGLVANKLSLSLTDLKAMNHESHVTRHVCIQGWTAIGQWGGVSLADIIAKAQPSSNVHRVFFESFQCDSQGIPYYTSLGLDECLHPQTILAYEMNYEKLPLQHGAPLRLRIESKLGFTMCKWIKSIHFLEDAKAFGLGHGGYREDYQHYGSEAEI